MLISTARGTCVYTLEPLAANQIGDHPLAIHEIGVDIAATGGIVAVIGLDVTGHTLVLDCAK